MSDYGHVPDDEASNYMTFDRLVLNCQRYPQKVLEYMKTLTNASPNIPGVLLVYKINELIRERDEV